MPEKTKEALLLFAVCMLILFAANYLAALAGHPTSLWAMRWMGVMD
jgi:hypothetical protein